MSDQNDILNTGHNEKEQLSEDKLMAYLEGKLSPAEQHKMEQWLASEGMESDALEGLRLLQPEETRHTVNKLNHKLRSAVLNKKRRRKTLKTDHFSWIAIAIILLLAAVAYLVIRKAM